MNHQTKMTLQIDTSVIISQTKIAAVVISQFIPLLKKLPYDRVETILNKFLIELNHIVFGYNVVTIGTDGTRKVVRTLRYRGAIEDFTATFWTNEVNRIHSFHLK